MNFQTSVGPSCINKVYTKKLNMECWFRDYWLGKWKHLKPV